MTTGKIKSVDLMRHVIMLEDGSTYTVARGVNIKSIKAGPKVTVTTSGFRRDHRGFGDHAGRRLNAGWQVQSSGAAVEHGTRAAAHGE